MAVSLNAAYLLLRISHLYIIPKTKHEFMLSNGIHQQTNHINLNYIINLN